MSGESVSPAPQDRTQLYVLVLVTAVALCALYKSVQPAPVAPVQPPVVIQPAPVAPAPVAPCSPCGPNRCPYRALPFPATCPYCRNRIVAFPPAEAGQVGTLAPPVPAVSAVGAKK